MIGTGFNSIRCRKSQRYSNQGAEDPGPFVRLRCSGVVSCHKPSEEVCRAGIEKSIHPHSYQHSMTTLLRNQGALLDVANDTYFVNHECKDWRGLAPHCKCLLPRTGPDQSQAAHACGLGLAVV